MPFPMTGAAHCAPACPNVRHRLIPRDIHLFDDFPKNSFEFHIVEMQLPLRTRMYHTTFRLTFLGTHVSDVSSVNRHFYLQKAF